MRAQELQHLQPKSLCRAVRVLCPPGTQPARHGAAAPAAGEMPAALQLRACALMELMLKPPLVNKPTAAEMSGFRRGLNIVMMLAPFLGLWIKIELRNWLRSVKTK